MPSVTSKADRRRLKRQHLHTDAAALSSSVKCARRSEGTADASASSSDGFQALLDAEMDALSTLRHELEAQERIDLATVAGGGGSVRIGGRAGLSSHLQEITVDLEDGEVFEDGDEDN